MFFELFNITTSVQIILLGIFEFTKLLPQEILQQQEYFVGISTIVSVLDMNQC